MARKKKHEEHENHERWLVSYADFITLLFAFFVVMYSISSVNEGKYRVLSNSLVAAFRASPRSPTPIQIGKPLTTPTQPQSNLDRRLKLVHTFDLPLPVHERGPKTGLGNTRERDVHLSHADKTGQPGGRQRGSAASEHGPGSAGQLAVKEISARVEQAMAGLISKHLIKVRSDKSWVQVEINTSILFPSGSATLSAAARPVLEKLATILKPFPNPIHVEGFTDNVPINTVEFPSNWELSAGRAATVVHLFTDAGVEPQRMAAVGYGQYHPVASNATAEGRSKNRRVVLVVYAGKDPQSVGVPGDPTVLDQTLKGGASGNAAAAQGGVGKTTTAVTLAGLLAAQGHATLLVDLDPHGSLSTYFGFDPDAAQGSVYNLFAAQAGGTQCDYEQLLRPTAWDRLHVMPASTALATLDRQLGSQEGMGLVLARTLQRLQERFEFAFIDCPPMLGVLMVNALAACDRLLIPVQTEFLALKGLERMVRTLDMIQHARGTRVQYTIVPTLFDRRTRASVDSLRVLRERYGADVWPGVIPVDTQFREASRAGMPLSLYQPRARGALAYGQLLERLLGSPQPAVQAVAT